MLNKTVHEDFSAKKKKVSSVVYLKPQHIQQFLED